MLLLTGTYIWHPTPISIPGSYWFKVSGAATAQILGTILLLKSFRERDFAVGTVYSKAEILLVAIASTILLKETPPLLAWIAIVVCMLGLIILTAKKSSQSYYSSATSTGAVRGMSSGLFFGLAAVGIRSSVTTLAASSLWHRSVFTLATMLGIQALLHGLYLFFFSADQLAKIFSNWRRCVLIGLMSVSGTTGWTVAMAMTTASRVRTLGQIEIVLAFIISTTRLKERHKAKDYLGSTLVLLGIIGVVVFG